MAISSIGVKEAGCLCAVVAMAVYLNTLDCDLLFDDEPAIKWNRDIRPHTPWKQILFNDFWGTPLQSATSHKSYRPLCVASFRLNYMLHGLQPMGYHLVNVLLHAMVCYLYVQLCALVFTQVWPALLAGLLFAVHPIHTEAVAGAVGRAELLSALFFLLAFLVYHKSLTSRAGGAGWMLMTLSIGLSVFAMLSKEQGITALALCLIYDFFIFNLHSSRQSKHSLPAHWKIWTKIEMSLTPNKGFFARGVVVSAAALVVMVIRLAISQGTPSRRLFSDSVNPPLGQDAPYRQLSWLHLVYINLQLLFKPSQLSVDWRYGAVPLIETLWDHNNLYTLATIAGVGMLGLVGLAQLTRNNKPLLLGVSLMVFPFLPASNLFFPVGFVVAERVLYLPSMGYCLLLALGAWHILQSVSRNRKAATLFKALICCLLVVHAMKTVVRNRDWHSASSLHRSGVRFNPNNPILLSNLGIEHAMKQDFLQAERLYLSSMKQTPTYSGGYYNYGILMNLLHRYREAEEPLLKAIEVGATDAPVSNMAERYNLLIGVISMNTSRLKEALHLTNNVLGQHPTYAPIFNTRCSVILKLNWTDQFIQACEQGVRRNRGLLEAHYNLGVAYMKLGHITQAETSFRNMLVLDQSSTLARFHLASVLQDTGKTQQMLEARLLWKQVLTMEPSNIQALLNLAYVDSSLHHYSQALDSLDAVLAIQPDNKEALYRAGQLLYRRKQYTEAIATLSRLSHIEPGYEDTMSLLSKAQNKTVHQQRGRGNTMDIVTRHNSTYT